MPEWLYKILKWLKIVDRCPNCASAWTGGHPDPWRLTHCIVCGDSEGKITGWVWGVLVDPFCWLGQFNVAKNVRLMHKRKRQSLRPITSKRVTRILEGMYLLDFHETNPRRFADEVYEFCHVAQRRCANPHEDWQKTFRKIEKEVEEAVYTSPAVRTARELQQSNS